MFLDSGVDMSHSTPGNILPLGLSTEIPLMVLKIIKISNRNEIMLIERNFKFILMLIFIVKLYFKNQGG